MGGWQSEYLSNSSLINKLTTQLSNHENVFTFTFNSLETDDPQKITSIARIAQIKKKQKTSASSSPQIKKKIITVSHSS